MKKRLTLFSLLLLFTMTAMAQTLVDGIYYNLNRSDNTAEVTDGTKYSGDIVIPASISVDGVDYSVTEIGRSAFSSCDGLTSIEIPNSVTSIGDKAFGDCYRLTSIEIPNSVTSIEDFTFWGCDGLTSIEIPNSVTEIGDYAFSGCYGLTSIEIPNSVTEIGDYAFQGCSGLTSIEIPNSVTEIGERAFQGCSGLTSITMQRTTPPTVGANLLYNCSKLEIIYVPVGASEAYNVAPWNAYNIIESTPDVSEVTFDFQGNPWELPLGTGSGETADAGNVEEITQDGVVLSLEQLSASTHPRMWTGPQLRVYKKNQLTVKAPAGKVVTKAVWTATGASYYGLTVNDEAVDATAGWSGAQAEVPFVVSVNGRYNTLVVTLANEESTSGIPENTPNYVPRHNGTKTNNDRDVIAVKLTGEYSGEQVYTLTSAEQSQDYTDVTASVVFKVEPGEELTPKVEQLSDWMHHAVYIDTDKNGFTGAIAAGSEWKPAGDLVSYSFYNNDAADDDKGWNSVGDVLDWSMVVYPPLPAFTAPTEPGIYRMRFVQDWCSIDPAGDADGKFGDFKENGGQIVDVMLEVVEGTADPEPEVPATPVVITEVSQLSNAKCYTLVSSDTGRGGMYALADKVDMCGVTYSAGSDDCHKVERNAADPKQQFAFVEYEGKHYLYSVSEKKFVMKSGDTNALVGEAPYEFVTVEKVGENTFALKANDTHYFTASPGWCANPSRATCVQSTTSQSEGDGWDAGAWFTITEAGEFNPEEALAMLTPAAPATPLEFVKANPVLESEVISLSSITLTFNKEIASVSAEPGMFWFVNADITNMYDAEVQINATDAKTLTITLAEEIKESGTYIAWFSQGAIVAADGTSNETVVELAWIVKAAPAVEALQLVSIDPAAGSKLSSVIKFTLTYNKPVTLKNEEGATLHANGGSTTLQVLVSETDAKEVVLAADKEITNSGSYELKLAAGTLEDADGGLNEALTFNYEVESANNTLNVVKTDPDVNVPQDSLKRVVLTFETEVYDYDSHATVNVTDASGAVVATGRMEFTEVWEEVLISFNKEISTPGKYTVTVPENTIYGNGTYNPEINLTYTIVADYVFLTDGEAYTNATEKETERIFYTREFNNTQWQSWYVPFDMDYNDISDEYTAACLNDIHEYDDDEDGVLDRWTMEVLILRPGETIYANLPYVIRAKEVGEKQFVVENTMLYPADEQSMDCSSMRMHYTFTGTYSPIEAQVLRDNGWLAMGNGRLVTPTTTSTLKANRWYLESTPRKGYGSTYQAPKRIELVVVDENGEVTGVEELPLTEDENAVWPADVYDLNGRLVKAQAKNLEDLPKGVYVVNGQKWVK